MTPDEHRQHAEHLIRAFGNEPDTQRIEDSITGSNHSWRPDPADVAAIADLIRTATITVKFAPKSRSDLGCDCEQPGEWTDSCARNPCQCICHSANRRHRMATWDPQPGETWRYVLRDELWQVVDVDGRLELHRPGAVIPVANVADPSLMQRVKAAP